MAGAYILVADDDPQILRALRAGLSARGYQVLTATTGDEALDHLRRRLPDVVLLDLVMPGTSGLEVLRWLRARSEVPVIILSARGEERDKVLALDLGADDYLTKPFGMEELLARIRVALRRAAHQPQQPIIQVGPLTIDLDRRRVTRNGQEVHLTPTEYDLLKYLALHAERVLTHRMILQAVWGPEYADQTQILRVFINQLRHKVEPDPARPLFIITEPGVGYRFRSEPVPTATEKSL